MSETELIVSLVALPIIVFLFYVVCIDPQLVIGRIIPIKYSLFFRLPYFKRLGVTYYDDKYLCPHCGKEIEELRGKSQ